MPRVPFFSSVFKLNFNRIFKYIFNLVSNTRPHKHVFCYLLTYCLNTSRDSLYLVFSIILLQCGTTYDVITFLICIIQKGKYL